MAVDRQANTPTRQRRGSQQLGNPVFNEQPAGAIDGTNTIFHLPSVAQFGTIQLFKSGDLQRPTTDYAESFDVTTRTTKITMTVAPAAGTWLLAHYLE